MPDQITVSEFVAETIEDYKSPTASNFTTRMSHCRNTVAALEEVSTYGTQSPRILARSHLINMFDREHSVKSYPNKNQPSFGK